MGVMRWIFGDGWGFADWVKKNKGGRRYLELNLPNNVDLSDEALQEALYKWVNDGDHDAKKKVTEIITRREMRR